MSADAILAQELVTLAFCWRLERRDGVTIGLTSHDRDLVVGGVVYTAAPGLVPSAITRGTGLDPESMAGQAGALACFTSGGWRFVGPRAGLRVAVADENSIYVHNGTDWGIDPVHSDGFYVAGERIVGAREAAIADPAGGSTVDAEARATVAQILSMLRTHGLIDPA